MSESDAAVAEPLARPFADRRVFPINYALMQPLPGGGGGPLRVGASHGERAAMIVCTGFYKPVSRCFARQSPPAGEAHRGG